MDKLVSVRSRDEGDSRTIEVDEFIQKVIKRLEERNNIKEGVFSSFLMLWAQGKDFIKIK